MANSVLAFPGGGFGPGEVAAVLAHYEDLGKPAVASVRADSDERASLTSLGWVPERGQIDLRGLDVSEETMEHLTEIDPEAWKKEFELQEELFEKLSATMPKAMMPPALGRLSITTGRPQRSAILGLMTRAMMSVALPGVKGTMMRIGRAG